MKIKGAKFLKEFVMEVAIPYTIGFEKAPLKDILYNAVINKKTEIRSSKIRSICECCGSEDYWLKKP